jgi:nitrogen fixation/metabolism regulation signal transduction histidine kinase
MEQIEVAVFTFDGDARLQFVNRAGAHLLRQPAERMLGRTAAELDLADCLSTEEPRIIPATFPGGSGRWEVRRSQFRQGGRPHDLLVISDVSQPLRDEERQAWQRLIRVMGHELNNSLAPIKSIAGSIAMLTGRDPLPPDWRDDVRRGLEVIGSRADSLNRFMSAYARLARLPQPKFEPLDVRAVVDHIVNLDGSRRIEVSGGPDLTIRADGDQIEQLLINLVRNATDAVQETEGGVRVGWVRLDGLPDQLELWIEDDGPGLPDTSNLFVPFFTTKPGGSGIGLVLSRQIAEAHGGTLSLENRQDARGCRATLRLPLRGASRRQRATSQGRVAMRE